MNEIRNHTREKTFIPEEGSTKATIQKSKETEKASETQTSGMGMPQDEYISSEKSGQKPTGLYNVEKDKDGNTVIRYDDPRRFQGKKDADLSVQEVTDRIQKESGVDLSVQKLRGKRDSLKIQLKQKADDKPKAEQLRKKLKEIERQIKLASK